MKTTPEASTPARESSTTRHLEEIATFVPHLSHEPQEEARENTHCLSVQGGDSPLEVAVALLSVCNSWASTLGRIRPRGGATFYAWYDDQAGQLRFSLTSGKVSERFGTRVELGDSLAELVADTFNDTPRQVVGWERGEPIHAPLQVWTMPLKW